MMDHWNRGRHSNIPRCCIAFFCTTWQAWTDGQKREWDPGSARRGVAYVRCPPCVHEDNVEPLHNCTAQCSGVVGNSWDTRPRPLPPLVEVAPGEWR